MDPNSIADQLNNMSPSQRSQLLDEVKKNSNVQFQQAVMGYLSEDCMKKCVKPQAKMDSKMTDCLNNCVDRFIDTLGVVTKSMEDKGSS